jgi:signal transduction histidine kinase
MKLLDSTAASPEEIMAEVIDLQKQANFDAAIDLCQNAQKKFHGNIHFSKMLSELYFIKGQFSKSALALANFIDVKTLPPNITSDFARLYDRIYPHLTAEDASDFLNAINSKISGRNANFAFSLFVRNLVFPDIKITKTKISDPVEIKFSYALKNDKSFQGFISLERQLEAKDKFRLLDLLDEFILNRDRSSDCRRIDSHTFSIYEKYKQYNNAKKIIEELINIRLEPVVLRSLFRICRLTKNYSSIDNLIEKRPSVSGMNDFNVLYELVYYYESKNDMVRVFSILNHMEKRFKTNLPVLRTLRNFYIRFGMIENLNRLEPIIQSINPSTRQFETELMESESVAISKIQELYSELEHQKQLAAISDLTTGISHELGQPITNIRYSIQFFKRIIEKNLSREIVFQVFDSILEETVRMGGLISRLAPLTSSRNILESFDLQDRIKKRIEAELPKLSENKIEVLVSCSGNTAIYGDVVKFDQLISNLLLNAIDALSDSKKKRVIKFHLDEDRRNYKLFVSDSGPGIPITNRKKIFDPFFSTKAPGKGEGLGLFIVWNLLQSIKGSIAVDPNYNNGAKFNITFPKISVEKSGENDK